MTDYEIVYYVARNGACPFKDFLEGSQDKVRAKFFKIMKVLEALGPNLKRPLSDTLRDGIRELRVVFSGSQHRAFYFFSDGRRIIVTHGIVKKSDRVPPGEIERAIRYRNDYLSRRASGEIEEDPPSHV
ncbi:MAG: type II toxin-antitoxin system RelE/ParE family toxin [Elusimicrobia bacterium]|nr:type II toxin-antitoxin system RelE/ParE family toxin [Elusimicrobiota bacterium]